MNYKILFNKTKRLLSFFTLADIILTILILAFAIILLVNNLKEDNHIVRINYQNNLFGEYKLSEPRIIEITKDIVVEIADNKVRMVKNNCPNQLCVQQGWSSNFPIICVPTQVEIIIVDPNKNDKIKHILK